jgi:hypothetical protein
MRDKIEGCEHEWAMMGQDQRDGPGISACTKCGLQLTHSNRLQLAMNKHTLGYQKWISLLTILISVIALGISIVALFKPLKAENTKTQQYVEASTTLEKIR